VAIDRPVTEQAAASANHPFVVALTGGIASGKTLVSNEFARLGVPVIDTDIIARQVVEPGQPALEEIRQTFDSTVINKEGNLRRSQLRALIFSDPEARKKLESILHPRIRRQAMAEVAAVDYPYCILVIPLFTEKGAYPLTSRVLVVDTPESIQIERLMARDDCSLKQANRALKAQASREQRLKIADDIIENSGTVDQVRQTVAKLHLKYLELARQNH
jgi:dephospho-CoA kinase